METSERERATGALVSVAHLFPRSCREWHMSHDWYMSLVESQRLVLEQEHVPTQS